MPLGDGQASLAISPDGARVAYVMERQGVRELYLHALDQLEGTPDPTHRISSQWRRRSSRVTAHSDLTVPGRAANDATRPVWVDRQGRAQPVGMPPRSYRSFKLSPDGTRLAIVIGDPNNDIWVQDLERGALTRLTSGGNNVQPSWTPDGKRVVFIERTGGGATPFWVPADGSGEAEPMFKDDHRGGVSSFSPKGELVAFNRRAPDTGLDLWVRPLHGSQTPQPFLRTRFTEVGAKFSPDGRWISYVSDESGQYEVYVRSYPSAGEKWQISTQGGEEGTWSRDGHEIFYRNGQKWMVVGVKVQPEFTARDAASAVRSDLTSTSGASLTTWHLTDGDFCCSSPTNGIPRR